MAQLVMNVDGKTPDRQGGVDQLFLGPMEVGLLTRDRRRSRGRNHHWDRSGARGDAFLFTIGFNAMVAEQRNRLDGP